MLKVIQILTRVVNVITVILGFLVLSGVAATALILYDSVKGGTP